MGKKVGSHFPLTKKSVFSGTTPESYKETHIKISLRTFRSVDAITDNNIIVIKQERKKINEERSIIDATSFWDDFE